jgi:tetratricopeptide (TPR) repeat protein
MGKLEAATRSWADPLIRNFLAAIVQYHQDSFPQAEALFRKCADDAPLVAAFHQGHGLTLLQMDRASQALVELLCALELQPDSRDLLQDVDRAMKKVPGAEVKNAAYLQAQKVLALYDDADKKAFPSRGISWLMPGREWTTRSESLPTPAYDRLVFRQALGVAVGKRTLLVDAAAVKDALELYVQIDEQTVAPASMRRISFGSSRVAPVLVPVFVGGYEFTPPTLADDANHAPSQGQVVAYALPSYPDFGSTFRKIPGQFGKPAASGTPALTVTLAPGDAAGPVFTADGATLLGFLAGKIDPAVEGGGADAFWPLAQQGQALKQARSPSSSIDYSGYSRARRKAQTQPAQGQVFVVHAIFGEKLD